MFARLIAGVLLVLVATGIVFVAGCGRSHRSCSTPSADRLPAKPLALKSAGTPGAYVGDPARRPDDGPRMRHRWGPWRSTTGS